jgi:hypothetical protein
VTGRFDLRDGTPGAPFSGTLTGERNLRLVLTGTDIVLTGTLNLSGRGGSPPASPNEPFWRLVLTQTGGANHGKTFQFWFRDGY